MRYTRSILKLKVSRRQACQFRDTANRTFIKFFMNRHDSSELFVVALFREHYMQSALASNNKALSLQYFNCILAANWNIDLECHFQLMLSRLFLSSDIQY